MNSRGSIVQAGYSSYPGKKRIATVAMVRYKPNGKIDRRFGHHGFKYTIVGPSVKTAAIAIQRNGRIVVTAYKGSSNGPRSAILRNLPSGKLDKTFFGDGKYFGEAGTITTADKVLVQPDGGILVAGGRANNGEGSFTLTRILPGR